MESRLPSWLLSSKRVRYGIERLAPPVWMKPAMWTSVMVDVPEEAALRDLRGEALLDGPHDVREDHSGPQTSVSVRPGDASRGSFRAHHLLLTARDCHRVERRRRHRLAHRQEEPLGLHLDAVAAARRGLALVPVVEPTLVAAALARLTRS